MKKALMQRGVPEKYIYLDYAGFRTLDSVVRAKEDVYKRQIFQCILSRDYTRLIIITHIITQIII